MAHTNPKHTHTTKIVYGRTLGLELNIICQIGGDNEGLRAQLMFTSSLAVE